jgi:hypothetical protein
MLIQQVWPWLQLIWIGLLITYVDSCIPSSNLSNFKVFVCDFIVTISICKVDLFQMYFDQSHGFKQNVVGISMG